MASNTRVYNATMKLCADIELKDEKTIHEATFEKFPSWEDDIVFFNDGEIILFINKPPGAKFFFNKYNECDQMVMVEDGVFTLLDVGENSFTKIDSDEKTPREKPSFKAFIREEIARIMEENPSIPFPKAFRLAKGNWETNKKPKRYKFIALKDINPILNLEEDVEEFLSYYGQEKIEKDFGSVKNYFNLIKSKKDLKEKIHLLFLYSPVLGVMKDGILEWKLGNWFDVRDLPDNGFIIEDLDTYKTIKFIYHLTFFYNFRWNFDYIEDVETKTTNGCEYEIWAIDW